MSLWKLLEAVIVILVLQAVLRAVFAARRSRVPRDETGGARRFDAMGQDIVDAEFKEVKKKNR